MSRKRNAGKVIIPQGVTVWHHELRTANALASAGFVVKFLATSDTRYEKSPDISINGIDWELKSPKTDKLTAIERNLKRASKQSGNIIIDSQRMAKIHDLTIQKLLVHKYRQQRNIRRLWFVNRKRQVIDVGEIA